MPFINGKYVAPESNTGSSLAPLESIRQNFESTGSGQFDPVYKRFPGFLEDYKDYIDNPSTTPLSSDFNEIRALNQSTGEKLGRSLGKFAVNATSTAVDGTIGLFSGLANMSGEKTGFAGNLEEFIDNPFSKAISEWADGARESLQVYRTQGYDKDNVLENMFSGEGIGNFWGDTIFSNAGYAVGAIATGLGFGGLTKAAGKGVLRNAYKTLGRDAEAVFKALKTGQTAGVTQEAFSAAKKLSRWNTANQFTTSALASIGEARMEAFEAEKSVIENLKSQGVWDGLSEAEQANIKQNTLNSVFGTNMALLSMSNMIQFGKAFSKPFAEAGESINIFKNGAKWAADPYNKTLGGAKSVFKLAGTEALEEGSQFVTSEAANYYMANRAKDPNAENIYNDVMNSVLFGLGELNTKEGWENMISGALIGGGMPASSSYKTASGGEVKGVKTLIPFSNIHKDIQEQKLEASRNQGVADDLNTQEGKVRTVLNERVGKDIENLKAALGKPVEDQDAEQIKLLRDTVVRSISLANDMVKDIADNNLYAYKNKEHQDLANLAFGYIKAGKIEDFKSFLEESITITPEELRSFGIQEISDPTTGKKETVDPNEAKSPEQVLTEHKEKITKMLSGIDKVAEYYDKVKKITGGRLNTDAHLELTGLLYSQSKTDERIKSLDSKLNSIVSVKKINLRNNKTVKEPIQKALKDTVKNINKSLDNEINLIELIDDLSDDNANVRTKALETITNLIKSKSIEDFVEFKDGLTTKELLTDVTDLAKLNSDRRYLSKVISSAFSDPAKFNSKNISNVDYSIEKDFETNNFPFIQKYRQDRLAIDALEESAKSIISENEQATEVDSENPEGVLEDHKEEIENLQEELDENYDQTPFKDWTTFIRTTGNQASIAPNSPEHNWYRWFLQIRDFSPYSFYTQTVDTIKPELRDSLRFWTGENTGYMTVAQIEAISDVKEKEEALATAKEDIRIIVSKDGEIIPDVNISLSLPTYIYDNPNSKRFGEIRFAINKQIKFLVEEEGLTEGEAMETVILSLEAAKKEYATWREGVKTKATQLNFTYRNPGARNKNVKSNVLPVVGSVLTTAQYNDLKSDPSILDVFIETHSGEGVVKTTQVVINGKTYTVYTGAAYIVENGVPTLVKENTLSSTDVSRVIELLKYAASNPESIKQIEDHLATFLNIYAEGNFKFYLFKEKGTFKVNFGNKQSITAEQLLNDPTRIEELKNFLFAKRYNINKKTLNSTGSTYTHLSVKNGSLNKEFYDNYKTYLFDPNEVKFRVWGAKLPESPDGSLDINRYINESARVNPTLQFVDNGRIATEPTVTIKEEVIPSTISPIIPLEILPEVTKDLTPEVKEELGITEETKEESPRESIERRRQEELNKATVDNRIKPGTGTGVKVGQKVNDGNKVIVLNSIANDSYDPEIHGDGYSVYSKIITDAEFIDGKMSKAAEVEVEIFPNKETADRVLQEKYERIKAKEVAGEGVKIKSINAKYDAELAALEEPKEQPKQEEDPFAFLDEDYVEPTTPAEIVKEFVEEPTETITQLAEQEIAEEELEELKEELQVETKEEVIEEVVKAVKVELKGTPTTKGKSKFKALVKKIVKIINVSLLGLFLYTSSTSFQTKDAQHNLNVPIELSTNILPDAYQQSAIRFFSKVGLYNPNVYEEKVDSTKVVEAPVIEVINEDSLYKQKHTFTQVIGKVRDSHYKARKGASDSLVMIRNQFFNEEGFNYVGGSNMSRSSESDVYNGVVGVAHFMILDDSGVDVSGKTTDQELVKASNQFKKRIGNDVKVSDYVPVFKRDNGKVNVSYKKASELTKEDIAITKLLQYNFGDINFTAKVDGRKFGFKSGTVYGLALKNGTPTPSFVYTSKGKDVYSRFSGVSCVFIFEDSKGNTIVRDFTGSINMVEKEGKSIAKQFGISLDNITIGMYDAGSYTAKPDAGKDGKLEVAQYSGYNSLHPHSGGALIIPRQNKYRLGTTANENTGKGKSWFSSAFKNAVIEPIFGLIDDIATAKVISGTRVLLSNLGGDKELFHEGFHLITNHLPKESKAAYNDLRKRLGEKEVRVQSGKTFINKKGKDLTDREADEYLAYQFEDYMLDPSYTFPVSTKSLFDKIKSFLKAFLEHFGIRVNDYSSENSIESLFKFAENAKNIQLVERATAEDVYRLYYKNRLSEDGTPEPIPSKRVNQILAYINYQFFRVLANPNLPLDKFDTIDAKFIPEAETIYKFSENSKDVYDTLRDKIKYDAENGLEFNKRMSAGILQLELLDEFIAYHKEFLTSYGLTSLDEIELTDEDNLESTSENINDVAGPNQASAEINWKTRMPDAIKLLVASLPNIVESQQALSDNIKESKQVEFDKIITILQNNLSNLSSYAEMVSKLEEKTKNYPYLKYITQVLSGENEYATKLKFDFFSFFSKDKQNVIKTLIDSGDITIVNAFDAIGAQRAMEDWKTSIIEDGIYKREEEGTYYIDVPKEVLEDIANIDKAFLVLSDLGIDTTIEAQDLIKKDAALHSKFIEDYKNLITDLVSFSDSKKTLTIDEMFSSKLKSFSRLKNIAELLSKLNEDTLQLSFINQDNKSEFAITLNTAISNTVRALNKGISKHLIPWSKTNPNGNPLTRNSDWHVKAKEIKVSNLKGVESNTDGIKTTKADNPTFIVNYVNSVLSGINPLHRSSVRSVEYAIAVPINKDSSLDADHFVNRFKKYLANELLAIQLFENANWGKNLVNYSKNGDKLRSFDYLGLDIPKFVQLGRGKSVEELDTVVDDYLNSADIKPLVETGLRTWYENQLSENKKLFSENQLILPTKQTGLYELRGFDHKLLETLEIIAIGTVKAKKEGKVVEVQTYNDSVVNRILNLYTYNDLVAKQEMLINIFGDLAMFKNKDAFNKRANLYTGTKQNSVNELELIKELDKYHPRIDGKTRTENLSLLVIADIERESQQVSDESFTKKMNIADAQSWMSPDGYRDLIMRSDPNNWSEEIEVSWQHQAQLFAQHLVKKGLMTQAQFESKFKQHLPSDAKKGITYYQSNAINVIDLKPLNIQKPQGIGPLIHKWTAGLFVPHSIKTSVVMLNTLDYAEDSPLMKLAEKMFVDGLDLVQTASASKTSGLKPQSVMEFEEGNLVFKPYDKEYISELGWAYFGIQNQIENKFKTKTTYSTQLRKQLLNNLKNLFTVEEREVTERKYHELTNLRTKKAKEALLEKLALVGEKDYEKIKNKLLDAFKNKSVSKNDLDGIRIALEDKDLRKFDTLITKNKIENVIFSFFRADVIMKKVNGDMYIQMSNAGTGIDLAYYQKTENGTSMAEVAVPLPTKWYKFVLSKYGSLEKFNEIIANPNQTEVPIELLSFVSNRIPCQAPNLIDVFKVKKFLHPFTGNKIILPEEHTTKTGSDFDVDKLLSYLNNWDIVDNKLVNIEYPSALDKKYLGKEYDRLYIRPANYKEAIAEIKERGLDTNQWILNFEEFESAENMFTSSLNSINTSTISQILNRRDIDPTDFYRFISKTGKNINLTKEEFIANWENKPVEDYVSFEQIDNEINRITKEIVLNLKYYKQLMTPTDKAADEVKNEILKYKPEFSNLWSDIITFKHNLEKTRDARVAGEGIAILAKQQSSHSLMQQFPVKIVAPLINKFFPNSTNFYIGKSLSLTKAGKIISISDIQSGVQTGYLDMENNNFILYGNSYGEMLNVFDFLLRTSDEAGSPIKFEHLIKLFAQPIVGRYLNSIASSKGLYYEVNGMNQKKDDIVKKEFEGYKGLHKEVINEKDNTITIETTPLYKKVKVIFEGGEKGAEAQKEVQEYLDSMPNLDNNFFKELDTNPEYQGYVLDLLLYYKEHSQYLSNLMQITQPDAKFEKNRAGINIIEAYKDDLLNSNYFDANDIKRLINETFLKEFENVKSTAKESYAEFFLTANPMLASKFKELIIRKIKNGNPISEIEASLDAIENYFIGYIINKLNRNFDQYNRLFLDENNLAKRIYDIAKAGNTNPVIKALYPKIKDGNNKQGRLYSFDYIKFHNKKMDTFQTDAMVDGIMELYDNKDTRQLAEDIVLHSIITSGLQYTPDSYQNVVPNAIYFTIVKPAIQKYMDQILTSQESVDRVWQQFMWELRANRPLDKKVVNTTSYMFGSGKQKPTYSLDGSKHKAFTGDQSLLYQLITTYGEKAEFAMPRELPSKSEDGNIYIGMLLKDGRTLQPALWKFTGLVSNSGSEVYVRIPNQGEQNKLFEVQDTKIESPEQILSYFNSPVEVNTVDLEDFDDIQAALDKIMNQIQLVNDINFQEEPTSGYKNRTIKNASADVTIAFAVDFNSAGEKLTKKSVLEQGRKYIPIDVSNSLEISEEKIDKIIEFINRMEPSLYGFSLNIAGNGIYTMKGKYTQEQIDTFTYETLNRILNSPKLQNNFESIRSGGQTGFDEAGAKAGIKLGLPTTILAPKGWTFRNINGKDISNEEQFKARFNDTSKEQVNNSKSTELEKPLDKDLNKSLDKFIEAAGIDVNLVPYLKDREGNINPALSAEARTIKTAKGIQKVINLVLGRDSFENRAEEVSHIFTAMLGFEHPLYKAMEKRITQYPEYEEVKRDYPELTEEKDIRFEAIGKVIKENLKELVNNKAADSTLQVWWNSLMRYLGKLVNSIFQDPFKLAANDILNANIKDYETELIQANSKLTEMDDSYLAKTGKYNFKKFKTTKAKKVVSLNNYQVKALNQKEIDKVDVRSDISLNTATIDEIKELLRDNMKEFAYIDAGGLSFLAEQVQKGNWKLSCTI